MADPNKKVPPTLEGKVAPISPCPLKFMKVCVQPCSQSEEGDKQIMLRQTHFWQSKFSKIPDNNNSHKL